MSINLYLWWSKGRGDPNLYQVTVRLEHDGLPVDEVVLYISVYGLFDWIGRVSPVMKKKVNSALL